MFLTIFLLLKCKNASILFLFLRFWVTGPFNVPFATLNSREPPMEAPSVYEKERSGVEVALQLNTTDYEK